jgi:hypothetical protein
MPENKISLIFIPIIFPKIILMKFTAGLTEGKECKKKLSMGDMRYRKLQHFIFYVKITIIFQRA